MSVVPETARRVLVVGEFYPDSFGEETARALHEGGHRVACFEMYPRRRATGGGAPWQHRLRMARRVAEDVARRVPLVRRQLLRAMLAAAERFAPEVVLTLKDYLTPEEVGFLKARTGARLALWFPDPISNLGRYTVLHAPYDAVFFKDPYTVEVLGGVMEADAYYLPEAFLPSTQRTPEGPVDRTPYRCDVTTAGTLHAHRVAVFKQLADFDVKVWGTPPPPWIDAGPVRAMYQKRFVAGPEKALAFTSAGVVVNTLYPTEIWGLNKRAFEAAGVGAFQMLDWRPGLAQLFEDGKEVVSFRGVADLRAKLAHYLQRPDERASIAAAGRERVLREHTYAHRLGVLLRTLSGEERGFPVPEIAYASPVRAAGHTNGLERTHPTRTPLIGRAV